MKKNEDNLFLQWLLNRLKYKHREQDADIINALSSIINNRHIISNNINDSIIESICKKYHADWNFDESELNFGHSEESRNAIKTYAKNLIKDYINEVCFTR
jgi:hypothetical protein